VSICLQLSPNQHKNAPDRPTKTNCDAVWREPCGNQSTSQNESPSQEYRVAPQQVGDDVVHLERVQHERRVHCPAMPPVVPGPADTCAGRNIGCIFIFILVEPDQRAISCFNFPKYMYVSMRLTTVAEKSPAHSVRGRRGAANCAIKG